MPHWAGLTHLGLWPGDKLYRKYEAAFMGSSYDDAGRRAAMQKNITITKFRDNRTHTTKPDHTRDGIYIYGVFKIPRAVDREYPHAHWAVAPGWTVKASSPAETRQIYILWDAGLDGERVWRQIGKERKGGLNISNQRLERTHWVADMTVPNNSLRWTDKLVFPASADINDVSVDRLYGKNRVTFRLMGLSSYWNAHRGDSGIRNMEFDPGDGTTRKPDRWDDRGIMGLYGIWYSDAHSQIPTYSGYAKSGTPGKGKTSVQAVLIGVAAGGPKAWKAYAKMTKGDPTSATNGKAPSRFPDRVETGLMAIAFWDDVPDKDSLPPPTAEEVIEIIGDIGKDIVKAGGGIGKQIVHEGGEIVEDAAEHIGGAIKTGADALLGGNLTLILVAGGAVALLILTK